MSITFEQLIETGPIEIAGRLVDASNATLFGKIKAQAGEVSIVYKPIAGERPLWDFPEGNLASREVAAYQISRNVFNIVPFTVLRDGPFGPGAVQLWIDTPDDFDPVEFGSSQNPELRNMALFDVVINNTDRKFGHILLDENRNLFGCDHGVSLHKDWKLRTVLWQFAGERLTLEEVGALEKTKESIDSGELHLENLLQPSEVHALSERINRLLKERTFPSPDQEWPAVPWPPV